jgi:hypothetical protein
MSLFQRIAAGSSAPEFAVYGGTCRYLPKGGVAFDVRYVRHEPEIAQATTTGAYYADLEVAAADLLVTPRCGDEVEVDGVRYIVAKPVAPAQANPVLALHRKVER